MNGKGVMHPRRRSALAGAVALLLASSVAPSALAAGGSPRAPSVPAAAAPHAPPAAEAPPPPRSVSTVRVPLWRGRMFAIDTRVETDGSTTRVFRLTPAKAEGPRAAKQGKPGWSGELRAVTSAGGATEVTGAAKRAGAPQVTVHATHGAGKGTDASLVALRGGAPAKTFHWRRAPSPTGAR